MKRRILIACAVAWLLGSAAALAQDFPSRPVTLVAPFPAGSVTDSVTRAVAQALHQSLGQPVIVDNKADRKSTRLNSSHPRLSRMPSSA